MKKKKNETINGFVHCDKCRKLFKYNGKQTSNLIRHKCYLMKQSNIELKKINGLLKTVVHFLL